MDKEQIQQHILKVKKSLMLDYGSPQLLSQSLSIIEHQQLEINDWEDECAALQRRYEDLDKSALETMNLLHEASHKVEHQQREIEIMTLLLKDVSELISWRNDGSGPQEALMKIYNWLDYFNKEVSTDVQDDR